MKATLQKYFIQSLGLHWLRKNLIHAWVYCSGHVRLLAVASDCYYNGLRQTRLEEELSYLLSGLVAIHEGHVAVHQNELEVTLISQVSKNILLNLFNCDSPA